MPVIIKNGDMFTTEAKVLVNTINCVGAMGKGIALIHKQKYPEQYESYRKQCAANKINTGNVYFWRGTAGGYDKDVILFPTKFHWKNPSEISYIKTGLQAFVEKYQKFGITSIAFPKLGCSNGGLKWEDVKPIMLEYLSDLPIEIEIWE